MNIYFDHYMSFDKIKQKYAEIHSSFKQAYEFFKLSQNSSIIITPIIDYYGAMSLSRGVSLILNPRLRNCSIKQTHGLKAKSWLSDLSAGLPTIKDLGITITDEFFGQFMESVKDYEEIEVFDMQDSFKKKKINLGFQSSQFHNKTITYQQLWKSELYLEKFLKKDRGVNSEIRGKILDYGNSLNFCFSEDTYSKECIADFFKTSVDKFAYTSSSQILIDPKPHITLIYTKGELSKHRDWLPCVISSCDNGFNSFIFNGVPLGKLGRRFIILYMNSILARYCPKEWMQMISGSKGDIYFPLIKQTVSKCSGYFIDDCFKILEEIKEA